MTKPRTRLSDALAGIRGICDVLTLLAEADPDAAHAPALLYLVDRLAADCETGEDALDEMRKKRRAAERRWR